MEEIIAEQADLIAQLQDRLEEGQDGPGAYWESVYDSIRSAWDAWAFAELGTATPSELDLQGRPELAALYETIR